jgi:two-component system CheB/CheR fusion protein
MKSRSPKSSAARVAVRCPIVGIGASAGGLEAFTQLLQHLPVDTGFGFVFVQHLDPQHDSVLAQLLARATAMPVHEAAHNQRVVADHVYVIPPNTSLGIERGILKLRARSPHRVVPRAIDNFFEALAKDQCERAIGVILSGNASDGTLGLEAIKAEGGLTFAQNDTARFGSMPRSAVAAGCVDFELPPARIAREIARIGRHPYISGRSAARAAHGRSAAPTALPAPSAATSATAQTGADSDGYRKIIALLRHHTGVDFSLYKSTTILRRMTRRTVLNRHDTLARYADFLKGNVKELDALYADTLINVTSFFRNADAFLALQKHVFAPLLHRRDHAPVRVWVLGCSTGQEAYSLAIAYAELAQKNPRARKLQIFATDLNEANLERARHGLYAKTLVQDVSPERLRRFFTEEAGGFRIVKSLRESIIFARHNLIGDPPFSRMDLISCRNVLIYLEPSLQKKTLPAFHYALKPGGCLFLGASESIGAFTDLFSLLDKRRKIFVRKAAPTPAFQLPLVQPRTARPVSARAPRFAPLPGRGPDAFRAVLSAEREADRVMVNQFAPPSVLIDAELAILQFRGPTGEYLEPPTGKASLHLLKMVREGLLLPLRALLTRAAKQHRTARREHVPYLLNGQSRLVNIEVVPLKNLPERRYLVLFENPAKPPRAPSAEAVATVRPVGALGKKAAASRLVTVERDLAETRDFIQSMQEQQEAANEELQASNEEGQSANEELQSLNEELETSKEELESTNEELTTVNEELAGRNSDLSLLNSDLTNLQSAAHLVVLVFGRDLRIRRFSAQAEKQFSLHAGDVGRPLHSVRHGLDLPDLEALVAEVIKSVRECESDVQDKDGHWFSLRVRPYVTADNKVDGAVLLLMDIHASKLAQREVLHARDFAEAVITTVRDPLLILDGKFCVQKANEAYLRTFQLTAAEVIGKKFFELHRHSVPTAKLRALLEDVLPRHSSFDNFELTRTFPRIGLRSFLINARILSQDAGHREKILLGLRDITERLQRDVALQAARAKLARHAGQLEDMVRRRTAQLTAANRRLETSVQTVSQGKEELRVLLEESQFMQEKMRHLTHQVLSAQEAERRKISRELHDHVVQTLVGINVELAALGAAASLGTAALKAKIARTRRLVEKSVNDVHQFARELRPAVLDDLGLIPALQAYIKIMSARNNLKINLTVFSGVEELHGDSRTVLYRVAQESLTNVVRHAHASAVAVSIRRLDGIVQMDVHDNGKSFAVAQMLSARTNKRLGLLGMRERVEMVGGTFHIESAPEQGTTVRVELPWTKGGAQ